MAERAITPASVPQTYAELRRAVELTMIHGQHAVELAKVRTYHETGRLIREHVLAHQDRADYGAKTIPRLAADLKLDRSVLQRCDKFYRSFPIWATWPKLSWAHFRALLPIADAKLRRSLATEANRNAWPLIRLEARIAELAPPEAIDVVATPGEPPGLHLIVEKSIGLSVDLGFRHYWPLSAEQSKRFAKGDIVRIANDDSLRPVGDATKAALFTYAAQLVRVVAGDTLVVALEVSPGVFIEQKLRLRGLDCPEMSTSEGRAARRFVEALLGDSAGDLVIHTTKPDKYDRYLADVFLVGASGREIFLNNALLENGHAVTKQAWEFGDWGLEG